PHFASTYFSDHCDISGLMKVEPAPDKAVVLGQLTDVPPVSLLPPQAAKLRSATDKSARPPPALRIAFRCILPSLFTRTVASIRPPGQALYFPEISTYVRPSHRRSYRVGVNGVLMPC